MKMRVILTALFCSVFAFGITAGIDYIFSDRLVLGGAFGYGSSEADFDNEGGETEASSVSASLYGLFQLSEIVSSTILVSYSWQDYSSVRNLEYTDAVGPVSRSIEGDTDGNSFALSAGLAADFVRGSATFTPTARVDYLDAKIDGFEENTTGGPDGLALVYLDQDIKSFRTALGMQASTTINTSSGIIVPHVRAEFIHEFEDNARAILARYLHDPNPTEQPVGNSTGATFTITTDVPDRDWFTIGGGLSAVFAGGMSIFIDYETVIGFADVSDHSITAGARIEF